MSARRDDAGVLALLAVLVVISLSPAWHRPESGFDEGFSLSYGVRVLEGDLPHRDFVSFYGPGNPFLVAAAFAVGGVHQDTERALGLLYRVLIVLGAAGLALAAGRVAAVSAGAVAIVLFLPLGVPAYATPGALAFALASLALLARARSARDGRLPAAAAGVLAGIAGALRPDFGAAVLVAAVPLLRRADRRTLKAAVAGWAVPATALAVHISVVGPGRAWDVLADWRRSASGRRLPFDPFSSEAAYAEASRLLAVALLCAAVAIALALRARARRGEWRSTLSLGLLSLLLVPYALSRLDYVHLVMTLACAGAALVVAIAVTARDARRPAVRLGGAPLAAALFVAGAIALAPLLLGTFARQHANRLLGRIPPADWVPVGVEGRAFGLPSDFATDVQRIVDSAVAQQRAGARTLFVGPRDLRRAYQNDAYLYYVLRDLEPASYYMEVNPGTTNRTGSGLAEEIEDADVLILNGAFDLIDEPNTARRYGPDEPNRVVEARFCPVVSVGTYELLRRCR